MHIKDLAIEGLLSDIIFITTAQFTAQCRIAIVKVFSVLHYYADYIFSGTLERFGFFRVRLEIEISLY